MCCGAVWCRGHSPVWPCGVLMSVVKCCGLCWLVTSTSKKSLVIDKQSLPRGCWRLMEVGNSTFSDFDEISFNWKIFHPTLWFHTVFYHFLVFTPLPLLYIRPTKKTDTSPKLDFGVKCAGLLSAYHKVWYLYHTVVLFLIHLELPHFVVPYSGMFWNILECSGIFWNIWKIVLVGTEDRTFLNHTHAD